MGSVNGHGHFVVSSDMHIHRRIRSHGVSDFSIAFLHCSCWLLESWMDTRIDIGVSSSSRRARSIILILSIVCSIHVHSVLKACIFRHFSGILGNYWRFSRHLSPSKKLGKFHEFYSRNYEHFRKIVNFCGTSDNFPAFLFKRLY